MLIMNKRLLIVLGLLVFLAIMLMRSKKKSKSIEIQMYGRESCPHTKIMKKKVKNNPTFNYVEVTSDMDIPVVPYFVNKMNGKTAMGSMEVEELLEKLK